MIGRFVCAVGCLVLIGAVCGARQMPAPIVSTEMDALAGKLAAKIAADRAATIVVVGGASADGKISELGVSLRDGLNDALARQTKRARVFGTVETRALLKESRVSEQMVYCNALTDWILQRAHADVAVELEVKRVENGRAVVATELFDQRKKQVFDEQAKKIIPFARVEERIELTEMQAKSAAIEYPKSWSDTSEPSKTGGESGTSGVTEYVAAAGKDGVSAPKCISCPKPPYTAAGRRAIRQGPVYLQVLVRVDGTTDNVAIVRPLGNGLDGTAVSAILTWKFQPCTDSQGRPVLATVTIQVQFQLY
jgi:TonB family protein